MITIEIRKAGFINKGAQLMLLAIVSKLRSRYKDLMLVSDTTSNEGEFPYEEVVRLGIFPKGSLQVKSKNLDFLFRFVPSRILRRFGIVLNKDIDVVIDAAGFAYSSQWGEGPVSQLFKRASIAHKYKGIYILMPQSFGPFLSSNIKHKFSESLRFIDLVFPRDTFSYDAVKDLLPAHSKDIGIYPDFTNLIKGVKPDYFDSDRHTICIVPNQRMLDKIPAGEPKTYVNFLVNCVLHLHTIGEKPFLLIHESHDNALADSIISRLNFKIPVIIETDPLLIKGIIGASKLLIGSRYHSLVSALTQNIPAIGTGWSHKYKALFNDFEISNNLLAPSSSISEIKQIIDATLSEPVYSDITSKLSVVSNRYKHLSEEMWSIVFETIDQHISSLRKHN